jgi:peptide/nickel transport system substrate-binding protein
MLELQQYQDSDEYKKQKSEGRFIEQLEVLQRRYTYIGWNEKRMLFSEKKVRQALTMAIDRVRLIRENLNGQGVEINGPFFYGSSEYDKALPNYPYDPEQAKLILEQEGWYDAEGTGLLYKEINGVKVPFSFSLDYFVKDPIAKMNCDLVAQCLKKIGIDCHLNGMDVADISSAFEEKNFDALYLAWNLGAPPDDPRQLWHSEGALVKGSSNMIGFQNALVDGYIDELQFEKDPKARALLYHKIDEVMYDEQPYTFLFTPKSTLLWWNWIQNVFIPKTRQDLVPGADVEQPAYMYSWLKNV